MWCTGLVPLLHVESFWTRNQARVPCIGRQILIHCGTRELLYSLVFYLEIFFRCKFPKPPVCLIKWLFKKKRNVFISTEQIPYKNLNTYHAAKSLQLCPTLCDPMDCSLPGFSVHGILQARTLEWVAISFSNTNHRYLQCHWDLHPWSLCHLTALLKGVDCFKVCCEAFLLGTLYPGSGCALYA